MDMATMTLAERVVKRLAEMQMNKAELALQIQGEGTMSCSRSMLSQYLNNRYPSDAGKLEERLESWLEETKQYARTETVTEEKAEEKCEEYRKPDVFESSDYAQVVGVCALCQQQRASGIIVGRSGYGKTHSLKQYAKLPKVLYIECNESMSTRDLVRRIEKQMGLPHRYGSNDERLEQIIDFFNFNPGYLLIVDEADKLINKYTIKKIELLRAIIDSARVGIVMAGEPILEAHLKAYDERFANRMDFYYKLHGLTKDEVKNYLDGCQIEEQVVNILVDRAKNSQNGCFRLFDRTMNNAMRVMKETGKTVIDTNILNEASAMMML